MCIRPLPCCKEEGRGGEGERKKKAEGEEEEVEKHTMKVEGNEVADEGEE